MNLHEYQAKQLFKQYGMPGPQQREVNSAGDVHATLNALDGDRWVVKAQVHAGGRGKAGGVKLARSSEEVREAAAALLGQRLTTKQTGAEGLPINQVFIEAGSQIERELYLSMLVDRGQERIAIMVSQDGGMDIEEVAAKTPERIITVGVHPAAGLQPYQARKLGFALGLDNTQMKQFVPLVQNLYRLFDESDASLLEINPLIVNSDGSLLALDAKINIEDNALFRQPDLQAWRDPSQEDPMERSASRPRSELHHTGRQHRLHGKWRRTRDGNHGCGQTKRR